MQLFSAVMKNTFLIKHRSEALRGLCVATGLSFCSMLLFPAWAQQAAPLSSPTISATTVQPAGESFAPAVAAPAAAPVAVAPAPAQPHVFSDAAEAAADEAQSAAPSFGKPARVARQDKRKERVTAASSKRRYAVPEVEAGTPAPAIGKPTELMASAEEASFQQGKASWYGDQFHNRLTANGERYNMNAMTAAHKTLPFGTMVLVKSPDTGKTVMVRINDRGPYVHGRIIDLSRAAATQLGVKSHGVYRVMLYKARKVNGKLQQIALNEH